MTWLPVSATAVVILLVYSAALSPQLPWALSRAIQAWQQEMCIRDRPFGVENAVAVHIRHLREKLEINPSDPRYIKVVWGQGYKMEGGKL